MTLIILRVLTPLRIACLWRCFCEVKSFAQDLSVLILSKMKVLVAVNEEGREAFFLVRRQLQALYEQRSEL